MAAGYVIVSFPRFSIAVLAPRRQVWADAISKAYCRRRCVDNRFVGDGTDRNTVGNPISVGKLENPSPDDICAVQQRYIEELTR
jgi:hypothetical protein